MNKCMVDVVQKCRLLGHLPLTHGQGLNPLNRTHFTIHKWPPLEWVNIGTKYFNWTVGTFSTFGKGSSAS